MELAQSGKIGDDFGDNFLRQSVQVQLCWMLRPVSLPVIIQDDLQGLELLVNAFGEYGLDARVFGVGNVRPDIEKKAALMAEGGGMAAAKVVFVIHYGFNSFGVQPVGRCPIPPSHFLR